MIRFINCIRKRADISDTEFRDYWNSDEFETLVQRMVSLFGVINHQRNLTLKVELNNEIMKERGSGEPFDAIIEYWWDNAQELMETLGTEEADVLMREMKEYQNQFIDFSSSHQFFTEA